MCALARRAWYDRLESRSHTHTELCFIAVTGPGVHTADREVGRYGFRDTPRPARRFLRGIRKDQSTKPLAEVSTAKPAATVRSG